MAIEEDVHAMLVGQGLHGDPHLLPLLVAGVGGHPATQHSKSGHEAMRAGQAAGDSQPGRVDLGRHTDVCGVVDPRLCQWALC